MTTLEEARTLALALPEATEQDHHSMPSFKVRGKIFATVPDEPHLRVMVDEIEIRAAVAQYPDVAQEFYWGKRLACVVVDLTRTTHELVEDLLTHAWACKAPKSLVTSWEQVRGREGRAVDSG
jgi:hypothetical protein